MQIEYTIVRSPRRKKLTLTVERDCAVIVHAPESASDETIRRVVGLKRQWLLEKLRHPQKYAEAPPPPGKEVVNGESALYLGREYRIQLGETPSGKVELADTFLIPASHRANSREVMRDWYIAQAKEKILDRVAKHAAELGVEYATAKIVDTRFRWGSCTVKNNVTFNWRLIKAPMFVIDYVIVHELAHLIEPNHTPRFWSIIRAKTASMAKAKAWLKDNGGVLEEAL